MSYKPDLLTVVYGGTGASTAAGARTNLGVPSVLFDHYTDSSVGGGESTIYSDTIAASQLANNGEKLKAMYGGDFITAGTESTQLLVTFAGTTIFNSGSVAVSTGTSGWGVEIDIVRVSSTVIRYTVRLTTSGATTFNYCSSGELTGLTLSNTNDLVLRGASSGIGSGAGDIVGIMGYVLWMGAV